jgi:hypothetical protein
MIGIRVMTSTSDIQGVSASSLWVRFMKARAVQRTPVLPGILATILSGEGNGAA